MLHYSEIRRFWMLDVELDEGNLLGLIDYLRGDWTGVWQSTYMK